MKSACIHRNIFACPQILLFVILITGCAKDVEKRPFTKPALCDSAEFSYSKDVRPVIAANCSGPTCHSGGNSNYDYRSYEVLEYRIRDGNFEEQLLLPQNNPLHMPEGRTMSDCDLFTLRTWIHQGYKNN